MNILEVEFPAIRHDEVRLTVEDNVETVSVLKAAK
jgi:hypothetical protein